MYGRTPKPSTATAHINERKRLRKAAERRLGVSGLRWYGGVLCYSDTLQPVTGVQNVPKPGALAIGVAGAKPQPKSPEERNSPMARRRSRRESDENYRASARCGSGYGSYY